MLAHKPAAYASELDGRSVAATAARRAVVWLSPAVLLFLVAGCSLRNDPHYNRFAPTHGRTTVVHGADKVMQGAEDAVDNAAQRADNILD